MNIRINICVTPNFNWMAEQKEEEKNNFTPIGPNEYFVLVCSYKLEHCCISCGWQMLAELFFNFSQLSKWIEPHFSEQQASNIRKALLAPPRGADKNLLAPQLFSSMWSPGPEDGVDIKQLASVFLLPDFLARNISNLSLSLFNVRAFLCFDLRVFWHPRRWIGFQFLGQDKRPYPWLPNPWQIPRLPQIWFMSFVEVHL